MLLKVRETLLKSAQKEQFKLSLCLHIYLYKLYSSPILIRTIKLRIMRWAGHAARMTKKRNACRILMGKPEEKRPLGTYRRGGVDKIKMGFIEIGWRGMDWIDMDDYRDQLRDLRVQ
jgi:hypothetical protein